METSRRSSGLALRFPRCFGQPRCQRNGVAAGRRVSSDSFEVDPPARGRHAQFLRRGKVPQPDTHRTALNGSCGGHRTPRINLVPLREFASRRQPETCTPCCAGRVRAPMGQVRFRHWQILRKPIKHCTETARNSARALRNPKLRGDFTQPALSLNQQNSVYTRIDSKETRILRCISVKLTEIPR